jgi:hypothetical protein
LAHHLTELFVLVAASQHTFLETFTSVVSGFDLHFEHLVFHVFEIMDCNIVLKVDLALELFILRFLFLLELFFAKTDSLLSFGTLVVSCVDRLDHLGILSENLNFVFTFASQYGTSIRN